MARLWQRSTAVTTTRETALYGHLLVTVCHTRSHARIRARMHPHTHGCTIGDEASTASFMRTTCKASCYQCGGDAYNIYTHGGNLSH